MSATEYVLMTGTAPAAGTTLVRTHQHISEEAIAAADHVPELIGAAEGIPANA